MKIPTSVAVVVLTFTSFSIAAGEVEEVMKQFGPLLGKVRGAVRYSIQQGKGCLPWATLAVDPTMKTAFEFGFTPETARELGDDQVGAVASRLRVISMKGPFTVSAIAVCETLANAETSTAISVYLEQRDRPALKLRFPFRRAANGEVAYVENAITLEKAQPIVFGQPVK
jgi:hypothetical protein